MREIEKEITQIICVVVILTIVIVTLAYIGEIQLLKEYRNMVETDLGGILKEVEQIGYLSNAKEAKLRDKWEDYFPDMVVTGTKEIVSQGEQVELKFEAETLAIGIIEFKNINIEVEKKGTRGK